VRQQLACQSKRASSGGNLTDLAIMSAVQPPIASKILEEAFRQLNANTGHVVSRMPYRNADKLADFIALRHADSIRHPVRLRWTSKPF
jgi:hypothetical protein